MNILVEFEYFGVVRTSGNVSDYARTTRGRRMFSLAVINFRRRENGMGRWQTVDGTEGGETVLRTGWDKTEGTRWDGMGRTERDGTGRNGTGRDGTKRVVCLS